MPHSFLQFFHKVVGSLVKSHDGKVVFLVLLYLYIFTHAFTFRVSVTETVRPNLYLKIRFVSYLLF
jgi:hypothetical protein